MTKAKEGRKTCFRIDRPRWSSRVARVRNVGLLRTFTVARDRTNPIEVSDPKGEVRI